jgi:hypothetical protein
MSSDAFVVCELPFGSDPRHRKKVYQTLHTGYDDESHAVAAALAHWSSHHGSGTQPQYTVYRADDRNTALIEVKDGNDTMSLVALYKVVRMQWGTKGRAGNP